MIYVLQIFHLILLVKYNVRNLNRTLVELSRCRHFYLSDKRRFIGTHVEDTIVVVDTADGLYDGTCWVLKTAYDVAIFADLNNDSATRATTQRQDHLLRERLQN